MQNKELATKGGIVVGLLVAGKLAYDGIKAACIAGGAWAAMKHAERKARRAEKKAEAEAKKA